MQVRDYMRVVGFAALFILLFVGCASDHYGKNKIIYSSHDVEIHINGLARICIDKVPSSLAVRTNAEAFRAFSVFFQDSARENENRIKNMSNYFNYEMERDWVLLREGDTIRTSFFQTGPSTGQQKGNGGILVYEWPYKDNPDTLVFLDSRDKWGKHLVFLDKTTRP